METLLSVGCSNTVGVDLEEGIGIFSYEADKVLADEYREANNFSTLVANNYNFRCVNLGVSGASNERIIFSAIDYIETNPTPGLVLINLSGRSRVTFEVDNRLLDFDLTYSTEHLKTHSKIKDPDFVPFIEFFKKNSITDYNLYKRQENLYRFIVLYLESRKIPFILSETIPTGQVLSTYTSKSVSMNFDDFNTKAGRKRAKGNHWLSDSHRAWSQYLIKHIDKFYSK
jgi:hypothetical protein